MPRTLTGCLRTWIQSYEHQRDQPVWIFWFMLDLNIVRYFFHSEMILQMPIDWANKNQIKIWPKRNPSLGIRFGFGQSQMSAHMLNGLQALLVLFAAISSYISSIKWLYLICIGLRLIFMAEVSKPFSGVHWSVTSLTFRGVSKFSSIPLTLAQWIKFEFAGVKWI